VLLDDIGADQLGSYGIGETVAPTPTLDCLAERGVRFTRAWAAPLCSPGRAALETGRLADRTTMGYNVLGDGMMPLEEVTLGELAHQAGYTTGLVGKWHLSGWDSPLGVDAPRMQGFDTFEGTLDNLDAPWVPEHGDDADQDYHGYQWIRNGAIHWTRRYAMAVDADASLDFIRATEGPWLLVSAFHAAHTPIHEAPGRLTTQKVPKDPTPDEKYRSMVEAADTELGRLLQGIDRDVLADTTIVVVSDNGTSTFGTIPPFDKAKAKATLYEGGLHVPMIVAGPHVAVPGSTSDALVSLVDVFPTVAELLGVEPPAELDGVSFAAQLADPTTPGPAFVAASWSPDEGYDRAIRGERYKLITRSNGEAELYDLAADPLETVNLLSAPLDLDAAAGLATLQDALGDGIAPVRYTEPSSG
ncbi:MAG: sulfatase-like hydrolase/transferase, partial [Myxococcota bacterium]